MTATATPPPPTSGTPFRVTKTQVIGALTAFIVFLLGVGGWLINKVYDNIQSSIENVSKKVETINGKLEGAAKDAGSLQVLLNEAPELRKNIQETHDAATSHTAKLDGIERSLATMNTSIGALSESNAVIQQQVLQINGRLAAIADKQGPQK